MRDFIEAVGVVFGIIIVVAIGFFGFILVIDRMTHSCQIEQIQMLRASYEDVLIGSEVLLPKVVEANQKIISYQGGNDHWFFDMFVSDDWDRVDLIKVKKIHLGIVK